AGRRADEVAFLDREAVVADAHFALSFEDEEELLVHAMAMEREGALAGRKHSDVRADLLGAEARADEAERHAAVALLRVVGHRRRERLLVELVDVDDVFRAVHRENIGSVSGSAGEATSTNPSGAWRWPPARSS